MDIDEVRHDFSRTEDKVVKQIIELVDSKLNTVTDNQQNETAWAVRTNLTANHLL